MKPSKSSSTRKVLLVYRESEVAASGWTPVIRTEPQTSGAFVSWNATSLGLAQLCQGNFLCRLKFEVVEENSAGDRTCIGTGGCTLEELTGVSASGRPVAVQLHPGGPRAPLPPPHVDAPDACTAPGCGTLHYTRTPFCSIHTDLTAPLSASSVVGSAAARTPAKSTPACGPAGAVILKYFVFEHRPTILDYLRGGVAVSFLTAIDFTGSNQVNGPRGSNLHAPGSAGVRVIRC